MALLMRKAVLLAKAETTYGVDSVATGAANAMLVSNLSITGNVQDLQDRSVIRPYLGASEQIVAGNHVEISFDVELSGSGAAGTAPAYGPLLLACALSATVSAGVSVTYAPVSSNFGSVTMMYNLDGVNHKITGARGTVSFGLDAKGIPKMSFKFTGLYNGPTDATVSGVSYASFLKPVAVNKENTTAASLFGNAIVMQSASIDLNNTVTYRNLVGSEAVVLTDRAVQGSLQFEAMSIAAFDVWAAVKNATTGALNITHGLTAGNIVQLACPSVQITSPQISDSDGIAMMQLSTRMVPTNAGNDEFTLVVR